MNAQKLGIITSLAIHTVFLAVLLSIPVAHAIPYMKTIYIGFAQQEELHSTNQKETKAKAIARPHTEEMQHSSQPTVTATKPRQDEVTLNDMPVMLAAQKMENQLPTQTESTSLGKAKNQAIVETSFGNTGAPAFLHREMPVYPFVARRYGKEGKVVLKLLIDEDGVLQNIEVIEPSDFGFTEAAVSAITKSTFTPAYRNGEKIVSKAILSVRFILR
ncbi:MAG: TonB family protein [Syntrophaceae bacterium]